MENDQEFRHSGKFCKKRFSCGRALGGHMRSHTTVNSAETEEKLQKKKLVIGSNNNNSYAGFEESANCGYGLRENPEKTWRLSDSSGSSVFQQVNKLCKYCGKDFQSLKALFGHMRCHSERFSRSLEDDSWSEEQQRQQQILDSQSVGNSEIKDGACQTIVIHQKMPQVLDLLDLILPAPIDEGHSHIGLKSWWVKNSQKHDKLGDDLETQFAVNKSLMATENNLVSSKHTYFRSLTTPPWPCLRV